MPACEKSDPDNVLLSRMPLKRMDAEQVYDSPANGFRPVGRDPVTVHRQPVEVRDDGLITPIAY